MADGHDIFRELEFLQQALSQNRKPLAFMISAGCPLSIRVNYQEGVDEAGEAWSSSDPLIQDIAGLTRKIASKLSLPEAEKPSTWDKVIEIFKEDKFEDPNIETILSFVRGLRGVVGNGTARGLTAAELEELELELCHDQLRLIIRTST